MGLFCKDTEKNLKCSQFQRRLRLISKQIDESIGKLIFLGQDSSIN